MKTDILLVEDDLALQEVLTLVLKEEGYSVRALPDVKDLTSALTPKPQLVLMDLGLPDNNAKTAIRQIRELAHIPVVIVSGNSNIQTVAKSFSVDYLEKPFALENLLATVKKHLHPASTV